MINRKERRTDHQRVHDEFVEDYVDVVKSRIKDGKDNPIKPIGFKRFTLAIHRHQLMGRIIEDIKKADLKPDFNKRGSIFNVMAIFFVLIIVICAGFAILLGSSIFLNGFSTITTQLGTLSEDPISNVSGASKDTFGEINEGLQSLRWISFLVLAGMFVGIVISGFIVRSHPGWAGFYVIMCVIAILVSIFISRTYTDLLQTDGLGTTLQTFKETSTLMSTLPVWVTIMSFVGGIIMFIGISKDNDSGGFV